MLKQEILKKYFGYTEFRKGQEGLINNILNGSDVIGIMPTGAGKSLCFQVPALALSGITLVVSPLISLMRDQVQALVANGVSAAFINSSLTPNQTARVIDNAENSKYKIIYVAPERLDVPEFVEFSQNADISMVTIDEAHCVSQWGQDFRPSYLKINEFIDKLPNRPIISAFTATATSEVKEDIIRILKLNEPFVMATGFDRENLYFEVQKPENKYSAVVNYLQNNRDKSGIIYCATRKLVEEVTNNLLNDGYNATRYHAGLLERERATNQDDFLFDRKTIMVATNAFGMGIDKSNVGFVIHYNMPKNIESYYQEAGRAGRDGTSADCILLYGGQDVITNQFFINNTDNNNDLDSEMLEKIKEKDRERLKQMTYYCHSFDCLREYILKYFGDQSPNYCDNCSNCKTNFEEIDITEYSQKIISCIFRMRERYGIKMIIDTLRGSHGEKVLKFGLDQLTTYGIMEGVSEKRIRDVINYLVLNEYIFLTNSEFPTAKVTGKGKKTLMAKESIVMKIAKDAPRETKYKAPRFAVNEELFRELKTVRLKLAAEQKVPAFVIFTDATLADICAKMPANAKEFLEVSGVGQAKLDKYGEAFLEVINKSDNERKTVTIQEFMEFKEMCDLVKDELNAEKDPIYITAFADKINLALIKITDKKISARKITDYLVRENYLSINNDSGKNVRLPTEKGKKIGINAVEKERKGEICLQLSYNNEAQLFLMDNINHILKTIL